MCAKETFNPDKEDADGKADWGPGRSLRDAAHQ